MLARMQSCILYQNSTSDVSLLDIPRSIEQAQGGFPARLTSSSPMERPYPGVEPKSDKASKSLGEATLDELLLHKHLELALREASHGLGSNRTWCFPRSTDNEPTSERKRKRLREITPPDSHLSVPQEESSEQEPGNQLADMIQYHNPHSTSLTIAVGHDRAQIPPKSTVLQGDVLLTLQTFTRTAPRFNLVILDPPWPNRSARRKKSYGIAYGLSEVKNLLSLLPIQAHLTEDGLVAVWVTNKPSFREMLLEEDGIFDQWGVRFAEEWVWLKITSQGEPICSLNSKWRKPYEILLLGRRFEGDKKGVEGDVKKRVIIGVPDLHSRKPNLSCMIEKIIGKEEGTYEALEIFARNLTAGWWGWGNEALKFQMSQHWQETEEANAPL